MISAAMVSVLLSKNFVALFIVCLGTLARGAPRIVEPYPENVYVIENETTKVACVVQDTVSNPDKIIFVRRSRFGDTFPIYDEGPDGRIYYQNETLSDGKLRVTLHFNRVTRDDDVRNGGYECQGYTGSQHHEYGFTVTVIERGEIPEVHVSNNVTAKFGDQVEVRCNVTVEKGFTTTISRFMWVKDGKVLVESYCPQSDSIKPIIMNVSEPDVGGIYTCHLVYKLRRILEYSITRNIVVQVQPKFFPKKKEEKSVKLVCSARGNPLVTEWKRKTIQDDTIIVLNTEGNTTKGKYVFANMNGFKDHTLIINDVQEADSGRYYCCIKDTNSVRPPDDIKDCQAFNVSSPAAGQPTVSSVAKNGFKIPVILFSLVVELLAYVIIT